VRFMHVRRPSRVAGYNILEFSLEGTGRMPARSLVVVALIAHGFIACASGRAQTPPSAAELAGYTGLHPAAAKGDMAAIAALLPRGTDANARDAHGRTPLHVAAHLSQGEAARALVAGGAAPRALGRQRHDVV